MTEMLSKDNEDERRFFVIERLWKDLWREGGKPVPTAILQGYVSRDLDRVVRIRFVGEDGALMTIKGRNNGGSCPEANLTLRRDEAERAMRLFASERVRKDRLLVPFAGRTWEVDEFRDQLEGVIIAEIELDHITDPVDLPPWVGREITGRPEFQNVNLLENAALARTEYDEVQREYAQAYP